jgi:hydroxymethylglutaryl-CoA lyase
MPLPNRVTICEVGSRDGLQIESRQVSTEDKVELVNRLAASGIPRIEVTSFVHPRAVPQMADAAEVLARIERRPGTMYLALAPNERGASRAIEAGADALTTVVSASESHSLANVNMTVAESLNALSRVAQLARAAGKPVVGVVSVAFGCPFEGDVPVAQLERIAGRLVDAGITDISLADSTGMANPLQVRRTFERLMPQWPAVEWHLHSHNTRGMAIAGVMAALEVGVTQFDASVGGLGGCPFAPGATGNVCTEDLVHCLQAMGIETGIDLELLIETARHMESVLGHELPGQVMRAGPFTRRYDVPEHVRERLQAV